MTAIRTLASSRFSSAPALLLLVALLTFVGQFNHGLWTPDEPRAAEIGRSMLESGDYLVPRLAGEPFLEKPPAYWWAQTVGYRLFGVSPGTARLPSAVFAMLTVLLTFDMARRIAGDRAGLLAACVLMTTVNFHNMHRAITDPALACFVALGFWAFQRAAFPPRVSPPAGWVLLVYLAGGLAFLSKGVVALGLLFGPVAIYLLVARRWSLLRSWAHLPGLLLLGVLCAAWPVLLWQRGGHALLDPFLIDNVLGRFASEGRDVASLGHRRPPTYYLFNGLPELLPWLVVLPAMGRHLWRRRGPPSSLPHGLNFFAGVLPSGLLLLSVPETKRALYMLPLLAPMAVAVGVWLSMECMFGGRDAWVRTALRALCSLALLLHGLLALAGGTLLAAAAGAELPDEIRELATARPAAPFLAGLLLVAAATGVVLMVREWRRRGPTVRGATTGFCAAILLVNVAGYPLGDGAKDLEPFVRQLDERGILQGPLIGFRLDETTRALLPFHGGRIVETVESPDELLARLHAEPGTRVLTLAKKRRALPAEVTDAPPILRWAARRDRTYEVYGAALDASSSTDP